MTMATLRRACRIYKIMTLRQLKSLLIYRTDFLLGILGFLALQASSILALSVIFQRLPSLHGWSLDEIFFIYAFANIPKGIDHLFTDNLWIFSQRMVVDGSFDRCLIRPFNPLFLLLAETLKFDALGELLLGFGLFLYATLRLGLVWSPAGWLLLVVTMGSCSLIYTAVKLGAATVSFYTKSSFPLLHGLYALSELGWYPSSVLPRLVARVITYAVPFAFTAFIPASHFLGRSPFPGSIPLSMVVSLFTIGMAYAFWKAGLRRYESSGT